MHVQNKPKRLDPKLMSNKDLLDYKNNVDEELNRYVKHGLVDCDDGQAVISNPYGKAYRETFAYFQTICEEIHQRIINKTLIDINLEEVIEMKQTKNTFYLDRIITKEDNPNAFERIKWFKNENEYLDYLIRLEQMINGSDDMINGYMPIYKVIEKKKEFDTLKLNEEIDKLLQDLATNIDWVISIEPKDARMSGVEEGTDFIFIPEDDSIHYMKYLLDEIVALRQLIREKEGL